MTPCPLEIFTLRCWARAHLADEHELTLHEAVDELQATAERSGLVVDLGQDEVQALIARAFA